MNVKEYENKVMEHYSQVAKEDMYSPLSTMKNEYVRTCETNALIQTIEAYAEVSNKDKLNIMDIGCGNGYTLSILKEKWEQHNYLGIEKNTDLRLLAQSRLKEYGIEVLDGDVRELDSNGFIPDVVISQRVIINLLDKEDQKTAIRNIANILGDGGLVIFIECFTEPLRNLNEAREEYGLKRIEPSFHNLYLDEDSFACLANKFEAFTKEGMLPENFLSSHFYISRVLHDVTLAGKPFMRNSHFVKFMTEATPSNIGDYSPIKKYAFRKIV